MVAAAKAGGFVPGRRYRLLVGYRAFAEKPSRGDGRQPPAWRDLTTGDAVTVVRGREVPGSVLVRDDRGGVWICPADYLRDES